MSGFSDWLQERAQFVPGNRWASENRLGDVLTGGVARAVNRNEWQRPRLGSDQTSWDDLAAVGTGNSERYRDVARLGGLAMGGYGLGALFGGGSAATGAGESFGLTGMEGAGAAGAGAGGASSGAAGAGASSGINWGQLFGRGGAGNTGIGALMMLLNANKQRKDANRPILSPEDEQNIVQQGTNAMARSLSTEGNPAGSGRAQQELQNYATRTLARLRYDAAIRQRNAQSQASNNMFGAGGFGLQALLNMLGGGGSTGGGASAGDSIFYDALNQGDMGQNF